MITNSAKKIFKNILFSLILILLLSSGTFLSTSLFTVNAASYTITYNANGENISTSSQSVEKGAEFTLPSSADSDIMWFREGAEVYNISSLSDFRSLGYEVIAGTHSTENKIYMLNTDLDLSGVSWTPFDLTNCFFNGNGHTISNLTISSPNYTSGNYGHTGLFARVNANILNLNLKNVNINITSSDRTLYIGGLAGVLYSGYTIKNCSVSGNISVTTDTANYVGGLVGSAGNFINCINTCTITTKSNNSLVNAGGIVGGNAENIKNCYNLGNISATSASSSTPRAGGITGHVFSGDVIQNCFNAGNVTAKKGSSYSSTSAQLIDGSSQATITNCYFLSGTKVNGTSKTATVAGQATVKSSASALASAFYSNLSGEVTNWTNASYPTLTFVENDKNSYLNYYGQYYAGKGGDKIKYNFASDITLKAMTYKNEAYLTNDWFRKTVYIEDIVKIIFTDNLADIESCTNKVSVGADDENGTPFTGKICNDVLACWDNATTITLYI